MKTFIAKLSITAVTIIGLATLITLSAHAARTVVRHQSTAQLHTEDRTVTPVNYGEVLNNLFGR